MERDEFLTANKPAAVSPLTGINSGFLFSEVVLGRYQADYYYDDTADFIFAAAPTWLEEAYHEAITLTDTGILARNFRNIDIAASLIDRHLPDFRRGVDIGAGYGLFVRGMRDRGYEFLWSDAYAKNLVARGYEAVGEVCDFAVAFEVLEHVQDPLSFIKTARDRFGFHSLCFSATCFPARTVPDCEWWYWAFETGQHISFFSENTLRWLAGQLDMTLSHLGGDMYLLSNRAISVAQSPLLQRVLSRAIRIIARTLTVQPSPKRDSLTFTDRLTQRKKLQEAAVQSRLEPMNSRRSIHK